CSADLAAAAPEAPRWFQVYIMRDRGFTRELIARAAAAGCTPLVISGDTPYVGSNGRGSLEALAPPGDTLETKPDTRQDPSITFDAIGWLREEYDLPVIV